MRFFPLPSYCVGGRRPATPGIACWHLFLVIRGWEAMVDGGLGWIKVELAYMNTLNIDVGFLTLGLNASLQDRSSQTNGANNTMCSCWRSTRIFADSQIKSSFDLIAARVRIVRTGGFQDRDAAYTPADSTSKD